MYATLPPRLIPTPTFHSYPVCFAFIAHKVLRKCSPRRYYNISNRPRGINKCRVCKVYKIRNNRGLGSSKMKWIPPTVTKRHCSKTSRRLAHRPPSDAPLTQQITGNTSLADCPKWLLTRACVPPLKVRVEVRDRDGHGNPDLGQMGEERMLMMGCCQAKRD